jgi:hypothetical protein
MNTLDGRSFHISHSSLDWSAHPPDPPNPPARERR